VAGSEKRRAVIARLKKLVLAEKFYFALLGIAALAALVNFFELLCSAGVPAVYVPILTLADLPAWQYYGYLVFYILIFLLDDLIIFFLAMKTLQLKVVESRFSRYSGLVGGLIMIAIGALLLFRPGWLMFG
jgi:hypothetical protein